MSISATRGRQDRRTQKPPSHISSHPVPSRSPSSSTKASTRFHVGSKIDPRVVSIHWVLEPQARAIVKQARKIADSNANAATAAKALAQAAADQRVTLTPHDTAMTRAGASAKWLDAYIENLRARGAMKEFTKAYKRHRLAAAASGHGFMSFAVAEQRLRRALIPLLMGGGTIGPTSSLFNEIFG
jgi:hypothetical protein